jgi:predicted small secreted protein
MTFWKSPLCAMALSVLVLAGCETTSAALDGVGGVFVGAGNDVRSLGGR